MDDTHRELDGPGDQVGDERPAADVDALREADPAEAPAVAEDLARLLSDRLDAVGDGSRKPEQLRAPIEDE